MENKSVSNRRVLFGLFLIVVGVFWILVKLNLIPNVWTDVLISWQMLLIGIGIFSFIAGNRTAGTILMIIGGFFLIDELVVIPYQLRQIGWPVLIIGVGIALLHPPQPQPAPCLKPQVMAWIFRRFCHFWRKRNFHQLKNFLGGKITSIFGGAEYDLRQASLSENGAIIDCVCHFWWQWF
jgi:predicted membrane protein